MFTGIIEATGRIDALRYTSDGMALTVSAPEIAPSLKPGDSIAVNGVCLTAVRSAGSAFECDLSPETVTRTSFAMAKEGARVNLERPLAVGARMGGHFVQGHVDGMGTLISMIPSGEGVVTTVEYPPELERYLVSKGSIAVDGISLTVASLQSNRFSVAVIPYTLEHTNLAEIRPGNKVNLEADILAKYFVRFFQLGLGAARTDKWDLEYLKDQGF